MSGFRIGTMVACDDVTSPNYGLAGKVTACHAPGATSKSGTAGFKYVGWRTGKEIALRGEFTRGLRRIDKAEFERRIVAACRGRV